jgi:translation elongation factor EF-Ts
MENNIFDITKMDLVHQIRKQYNYGIYDIKMALLKSNYNIEDTINLLLINKYRIANDNKS